MDRDGRPSNSLTPEQVDAVLTTTACTTTSSCLSSPALAPKNFAPCSGSMCTSVTTRAVNSQIPRMSKYGAQFGRPVTRRRADRVAPLCCRVALRRGATKSARSAGSRANQVGSSLAGCRPRLSLFSWHTYECRETRGAASAARSNSCQISTRWTGRHASCGTPSSLYFPMPVCRWKGSPASPVTGTTVTELVYRHQLKPEIQTGATVMDRLFGPEADPVVTQLVTHDLDDYETWE